MRAVVVGGYGNFGARVCRALALYLLVGACWLPVVWLQLRLRGVTLLYALMLARGYSV